MTDSAAATPTPLIVIVGQTASGKTALALELAERFGGEIICADSRTIYRGMDIGTAKPTETERSILPHHCLDLIDPDETFSAADFKRYALEAIEDIGRRSKIPIIVGGTGLYIDAVLFDYKFGAKADNALRKSLSAMTVKQLQALVYEKGYVLPENAKNKRYLIRTIERRGDSGVRSSLRANTLVLGLRVPQDELKNRITLRVENMFSAGFLEEYLALRKIFPSDSPGFLAPGYKALAEYCNGTKTLEEAKALFVQNDWRLAKRQRTWFKRNDCIQWVDDRSKAVDLVTTFLNN